MGRTEHPLHSEPVSNTPLPCHIRLRKSQLIMQTPIKLPLGPLFLSASLAAVLLIQLSLG